MIFFILNVFIQISLAKIIAYTNEENCPEGWIQWKMAQCRTIVIEGQEIINGKKTTCMAFQRGGQFNHTLTIQQMANHYHQQGSESLFNFFGGGVSQGGRLATVGPFNTVQKQFTSTVGESKPFNIRDPYIVLKACELQTSNLISPNSGATDSGATNQQETSNLIAIISLILSTFQGFILITLAVIKCYRERNLDNQMNRQKNNKTSNTNY